MAHKKAPPFLGFSVVVFFSQADTTILPFNGMVLGYIEWYLGFCEMMFDRIKQCQSRGKNGGKGWDRCQAGRCLSCCGVMET